MAVIQREVSVAANAVVDNLLSGSAFEFLRSNAVISIGVTGAATGLQVTINSGADIILEESAVYIKTQFPIIPDEMFYTDVGAQGDRLVVRIRNTTAGAIIVRCVVQVTAL
jgi:hypothetical protein